MSEVTNEKPERNDAVKDIGRASSLEVLATAIVYMRAAGWRVIIGNTSGGRLGINIIGAQMVEGEDGTARFREIQAEPETVPTA